MNNREFTTDVMPCFLHQEGCTVVKTDTKHNTVFLKTPDGKIYHMRGGRQPLNLAHDWSTNDKERRAYAKLAGIKLKDIKDAMRAAKAAQKLDDAHCALEKFRRDAKKFGFSISKIKVIP
jgi:hypothetical protein